MNETPSLLNQPSPIPPGLKQRTCDRCQFHVVEDDVAELFEMQEFVHIRIGAGYGARHFEDGDIWEAWLCQRCAFELFSPFARRVATMDDWLIGPTLRELIHAT